EQDFRKKIRIFVVENLTTLLVTALNSVLFNFNSKKLPLHAFNIGKLARIHAALFFAQISWSTNSIDFGSLTPGLKLRRSNNSFKHNLFKR
ncbi:hypothetical protein BpHYR1_038244, partial [Brachionus plicatilis]